ncbi:MBL fold metallo-hydrolase [Paenibacillus qinlingensis]|uniref:Ribonuclease BN (tRNA processing enzyme) n=1 Tax=Paenibacillus qinlingensis TaxID=1837343 RepID=A0ABU1NWS4_9BACL|nr:MBL fold metallo-hydrolase [Paenibacillus qinlingensis]MDR6551447.1 ribonuclease BN (tRNA processing enzyme) [Paenibacillus qinlingensis]
MSLQIQMLGTGSAFSKLYYNTSALVRSADAHILIDCGPTTPKSLHELGIELDQIDGILISHIHADHVGGLEEVAFRLFYQYNRKRVKLYVTAALADTLWENSLKGGLYNPDESFHQLQDYFEIVYLQERQPYAVSPKLTIEIIPTLHIAHKLNYSIFINHRTFYSADLQFNQDLLLHEVIDTRDCHTIFHDCQLSGQGFVHTTLDELLSLPEPIQKLIYLMHYDDHMPDYIGQTGQMTFIHKHEIIQIPD